MTMRTPSLRYAWAVVWIACMSAVSAQGTGIYEVRISAERVNLRAKAGIQSEVVSQVSRGDRLQARSVEGDWIEVIPPMGVDLWVHADYVAAGRVQPSKLNVRAGPGINYSVVGTLEGGFQVVSRGRFGEWLKIEPPPGTALWMHKDLAHVERPKASIKPSRLARPRPPVEEPALSEDRPMRSVNAPPPRMAKPEESTDVSAGGSPLHRSIGHTTSPPAEQEEGRVTREGELKRVGFVFGRPSRYRLALLEQNRYRTLCYVKGNERQLQSLLDKRLAIRGREYWVQGVRHPVIIPEAIALRDDRGASVR